MVGLLNLAHSESYIIFAQVWHTLEDWQEGYTKEQQAFSVEAYRKEYDGVLKDLIKFQEDEVSQSNMSRIWEKIINIIKWVPRNTFAMFIY